MQDCVTDNVRLLSFFALFPPYSKSSNFDKYISVVFIGFVSNKYGFLNIIPLLFASGIRLVLAQNNENEHDLESNSCVCFIITR